MADIQDYKGPWSVRCACGSLLRCEERRQVRCACGNNFTAGQLRHKNETDEDDREKRAIVHDFTGS